MLSLITICGLALAEEPPQEALGFARSATGVAEAVEQVLPDLRACVGGDVGPGVRVIRLRFEVSKDGTPSESGSQWTDGDEALAACLSEPFTALRFQEGEQALPVEIPVSVVVEEEHRREVRPLSEDP